MRVLFPERLKELRVANYMTQERLATFLNYGSTAIANYESGRNQPSIGDLIRLAQVLNVSVDYLIGASDRYCTFIGEDQWQAFIQHVPNEIVEAFSILLDKMIIQFKKETD